MLVGEKSKLKFQEFSHFFSREGEALCKGKRPMALLVGYALEDLVTDQAHISAATHP